MRLRCALALCALGCATTQHERAAEVLACPEEQVRFRGELERRVDVADTVVINTMTALISAASRDRPRAQTVYRTLNQYEGCGGRAYCEKNRCERAELAGADAGQAP